MKLTTHPIHPFIKLANIDYSDSEDKFVKYNESEIRILRKALTIVDNACALYDQAYSEDFALETDEMEASIGLHNILNTIENNYRS